MHDVVPDLIKSVGFLIKVKNGHCTRCDEDGPVLEITALVYYPPPHGPGAIESRWSVEYCRWCLEQEFKEAEKKGSEVDKIYG